MPEGAKNYGKTHSESFLYIAIARFGKIQVNVLMLQKIGKVAFRSQEVNHIADECCLCMPSGKKTKRGL